MTEKTMLRKFQDDAVRKGVAPLRECLNIIRQARHFTNPEAQVNVARESQGGLLINAPTGIGKTLIAGSIAQELSADYKVVWMWFAPFSGIVDQTVQVIRREFPVLTAMNPAIERNPDMLQSGNVYVSTWAGVASRRQEALRMRQESEAIPSIDRLLEYARTQGFEVGAVIDEAHHSFRPGTAAFQFCRDVLQPTVSIMVTATPRKREIDELTSALGIKKLSEINISRETGVDNHLLKRGVKAVLFRAPPSSAETVDFKRLALREAVREHRAIQSALEKAKIEISPLLMVQADEEKDSPTKAKKILEELEISSDVIRVHTADEPDENFLRIAEDESAEVLIFKMAAATGFDAPRAFVLASLRRSRDENFGVQIIGRIMRKHRAHQDAHKRGKKPPKYLDYGYVFLADHQSQGGLLQAADRINAVRDQITTLTGNIGVVFVGDKPEVRDMTQATSIFSQLESVDLVEVDDEYSAETSEKVDRSESTEQPLLMENPPDSEKGKMPEPLPCKGTMEDGREVEIWDSEIPHPLRTELHLPKRLQCSYFNPDKAVMVTRDVVDRIMLANADIVALANKEMETVCMETLDLFQRFPPLTQNIQADIALAELKRLAQSKLSYEMDTYGHLHEREFKRLFMDRLRRLAERNGWNVDDEFIRKWMIKILACQPKSLRRAMSHVIAENIIAMDADDLPTELIADRRLTPSARNIYGVYPPGMNTWEKGFAEMMDADTDGIVRWWHRNPVKRPWSANAFVPGFGEYFPDFVVGVDGRAGDGILLVETKRDINDERGEAAAKTRTKHPRYGRIMMLWLDQDSKKWHLVEPNENGDNNKTTPDFHLRMMRGY